MKKYLPIAALCVGFVFDFLFWKKTMGISFVVFIVFCLLVGFWLLFRQHIKPSRNSFVLLIPILFFSAMTFVRNDPFTTLLNYALTLFFVAILGMTFVSGMWASFNLQDYLVNFFRMVGSLFIHPRDPKESKESQQSVDKKAKNKSLSLSILRGVLLAIPVLVLFIVLFSSADLVFAQKMNDILASLQIKNMGEYLIRGFLILLIAYFFAGLLLHAAFRSKPEKINGTEKSMRNTFLGFMESTIILGSVILLFGIFIAIQFRYLFFGESNISFTGFTYSEYARRGFGELIAVAVLSLLLMQGLSVAAKKEIKQQKKIFNGLLIGLVCAVLLILVSAFQRLLLYESAYGFSQLRTYAHILMIWLGILLIAVAIFEIKERPQIFANLALLVLMGFTASLNFLNVDGFIVRQNIRRAAEGQPLDVSYLAELYTDSVPALVKEYSSDEISSTIHDEIGAALVCHAHLHQDESLLAKPWQSFNLSDWRAERAMQSIWDELKSYTVLENNGLTTIINSHGVNFTCRSDVWID